MNTKPLIDPSNRGNVGHIKAEGSQVVGPYSVHPSGKLYLIENAVAFATTVTEQQLHEVLGRFIAAKTRKEFTRQKGYTDDLSFPILRIPGIKPGLQTHPVHGSKGGLKNLNVDPDANLWYCHACQTGGTSLHLLAVVEGLVGCWAVGQLRGEAFK